MRLHSTHSAWLKGAKEFGAWLTRVRGVAYVNQGNIRSSHVKSGKRGPEVLVSKHSVIVEFFADGGVQRFFVFPLSKYTIKGLARRIRKAINDREICRGVGESSKSEVIIPDHIKRRQGMEITSTAQDKPGEAGEPLALTKLQAEGYQFLLSLAPSPEMTEFRIIGLSAKLLKRFGTSSFSLFRKYKNLGLVVPGPRQPKKGKGIAEKEFTVVRKPYIVKAVSPEPKRQVEGKSAGKRGVPQETQSTLRGRGGASILHHVEEIESHLVVLSRLGFIVQVGEDGSVVLKRAKKR